MKTIFKNITKIPGLKALIIIGSMYFSGKAGAQTCVPLASTPSSGQNYIVTYTPRVSGITDPATLQAKNTCQVMQTVKYFDGLGRPVQTVQTKGNPDASKDVIAPVAYDGYGREITKYMPYTATGTSGSYRTNAFADQATFYDPSTTVAGVVRTTMPYDQVFQEFSPLSRPLEDGAPGTVWQPGTGHTTRISYTYNNHTAFDPNNTTNNLGSRQAVYYTVTISSTGTRSLNVSGTYNDNELEVTIARDENWVPANGCLGTTETYTDKEGRVVLKRTYNYNAVTLKAEMLSTYYVYDDFGLLCYVLPPQVMPDAGTAIDQTTLGNLCYQYYYDERGRQVQKRIPGKGWEYTIYNFIDQPVATQDYLQRAARNWIITKYDGLGRPLLTGIWNNGNTAITRADLQDLVSDITTNLWEAPNTTGNYYTNTAWPTTSVTATLSINYYDDYANIPGKPAAYSAPSGSTTMTRGLMLANKTAVLNTPTDALWAVNYYDVLGRNIKSYKQHYLGGSTALNTNNYDAITSTYDFTNAVTTTARQHYRVNTLAVTVINSYIYDHMGRRLKNWETIQNGSLTADTRTLISKTDYNEIGQVSTKHLHSTDSLNYLQDIAYTYNERNWLLTSSAPLFAMQLYYNTGGSKAYNGNILYQWSGVPGNLSNHYHYTYDSLNRLISGSSSGNYNETGISYDLNGNITALKRSTGTSTLTDDLTYTYTSGTYYTNQLQTVNDATNSNIGLLHGGWGYIYDANGNLTNSNYTLDATKNKSSTYNLLNLPLVATVPTGTVSYTYDAGGRKLRKAAVINSITTNTDYIDGIEYDNSTTTIGFIQTEEGKAIPNGATAYNYEYFLSDHLGNTRVAFDTKTGAAVKVQADDYYPFGMEISVTPAAGTKNEYLYNKKELQENTGLYDYGTRFYDPIISRWNNLDPKTELLEMSSPYVYALNSPIGFIDKDGELPIFINGKTSYDGERGKSFYWDAQLIRTITSSGIPNPGGTIKWVDGNRGVDANIYQYTGKTVVDKEALWPSQRIEAGKIVAKDDFEDILSQLEKDPNTGKIVEKIQIYTHSRGAAFGAGYTEELLELIKQNANKFEDPSNEIEYVINLAPHQSNFINAPVGVPYYSIDHGGDMLSGNDMGNTIAFQTNTGGIHSDTHKNGTFVRELGAFLQAWQENKKSEAKDNVRAINNFLKLVASYGISITVN